MFTSPRILRRPLVVLIASTLSASTAMPVLAADQPATPAPAPSQNVTVNLINRLVERGVLTRQDSADLLLLAEADAAEAHAQAILVQAALAQAAAAQARARATAAQLVAGRQHAPAPADAPLAAITPPAPAPQIVAPAPQVASTPAALPPPAPAEPVATDDEVRVTYIPEYVKAQLRAEIKDEVMAKAREENWAAPRMMPEWTMRLTLFGDLRTRFEGQYFPDGNDNLTGAFPNFNAINTGAPFDTTGLVFSPQYNVDQQRTRARLRARMGAAIDLGSSFTSGLRLATGESNSPVSQNQSLGAPSAGQGGNFSKYSVWLDRAFTKYQIGGQPDRDLAFSIGRFDNPFFSTSLEWADDLGFDGAVAQGKFPVGEDITPFFTAGLFPVFNTDLNFASNQPAKFVSNDKWLYGGQLGVTLEITKDIAAKIGGAYYHFSNVDGRRSSPFLPLTTSDAGDSDATRPTFAQKGNTYMALRDIVADPLNANGEINQWQYFGLASEFREVATLARIDFNHFEPFQISLIGQYIRNLAFDAEELSAEAVNNRDVSQLNDPLAPPGRFLGGGDAWMAGVRVGAAALQKRWDWNLNLNYRNVESDAVIDGFADSDFGGGGTNVKGYTVGGALAFSSSVWFGVRWMSANEVAGPTFKNDVLQMDINGKF